MNSACLFFAKPSVMEQERQADAYAASLAAKRSPEATQGMYDALSGREPQSKDPAYLEGFWKAKGQPAPQPA